MLNRALLLTFVCLTISNLCSTKRPFDFDIKNFTCTTLDPEVAQEFSCSLRKRTFPTLAVRFNLKKKVEMFNLLIDLAIVKRDHSRISMGHFKLDGCQFLESFYINNVFGRFLKRLQSVSHLPAHCPVPANTLFEIRNFTVRHEDYPPNPPSITHEWELKIQLQNRIIAKIYFLGTITH